MQEFILLQNQGQLRVVLRGHVLLSESMLETPDMIDLWHLFREAEPIPTGLYVMLTTGHGTPGWRRTRDGAPVYHTYMERDDSVWEHASCPIHVLAPHHSFAKRGEMVTLQ